MNMIYLEPPLSFEEIVVISYWGPGAVFKKDFRLNFKSLKAMRLYHNLTYRVIDKLYIASTEYGSTWEI
jgi:hypothetical protein